MIDVGQPLVLIGVGLVVVLVTVFLFASRRPVDDESRQRIGGFVPALLALGICLAAASVGFGLEAFVFAPPMLVVGLTMLAVSVFAWLESAFAARPPQSSEQQSNRDLDQDKGKDLEDRP